MFWSHLILLHTFAKSSKVGNRNQQQGKTSSNSFIFSRIQVENVELELDMRWMKTKVWEKQSICLTHLKKVMQMKNKNLWEKICWRSIKPFLLLRPEMKKRFYSKRQVERLSLNHLGSIRLIRNKNKFGSCHILRKAKTIRNPFRAKSVKRFEPKRLKHYQVQYIKDKGFLPSGKKWHLSHRCHNRLCINTKHIVCEPKWKNHSRDGCKRIMKKIKKKKNETICCKKHDPCCFLWRCFYLSHNHGMKKVL